MAVLSFVRRSHGNRASALARIARAAALPLALATAAAAQPSDPAPPQIGQPLFPLLTERGHELARVTVETGLYSLVLERRDGIWVAVDRGDFIIQSRPIDAIVAAVTALPASELATADPARHAEFAVAAASAGAVTVHVTATTAAGEILADAMVGTVGLTTGTPPRGGTYVRRGGEDEVWISEGFVTVPQLLPQWFPLVANVRGPNVAAVSILNGERVLLASQKTDFETGDYVIAALDPELGNFAQAVINIDGIRGLVQAVVTIAPLDVVPREAVTVSADARTIRYEMRDGLRLDVTLADRGGEPWVLVDASAAGAEAEAAAAAIRALSEHWAFRIADIHIATLSQDMLNLYAIIRPPTDDAIPY